MHAFLRRVIAPVLLWLAVAPPAMAQQQQGPLVLAAASLQESLSQAASIWVAQGHPRPILSFAASSALARQIEAGAPADLFVSADEPWMDAVASKGLIVAGSRTTFLANRLVLVAPADSRASLRILPRFPLARALGRGRLAMADPDAVPAGRYGKAALEKLGVWSTVAGKIARAENVRAALALVERQEAPFGIVYATDAKASTKVRVAGIFPQDSHPAIIYPIARLRTSKHRDAEAFRHFLLSPQGMAIFARHGFTPYQARHAQRR